MQTPLKDAVSHLITPVLNKKGMHYVQLLNKWSEIAGASIAKQCIPLKLTQHTRNGKPYGVLTLQTESSATAAELAYQVPLLQEKIAQFFGFSLVSSIRITHLPSLSRPIAPEVSLSEAQEREVATQLETEWEWDTLHEEVRDSLQQLGKAILRKQLKTPASHTLNH